MALAISGQNNMLHGCQPIGNTTNGNIIYQHGSGATGLDTHLLNKTLYEPDRFKPIYTKPDPIFIPKEEPIYFKPEPIIPILSKVEPDIKFNSPYLNILMKEEKFEYKSIGKILFEFNKNKKEDYSLF